MKTALVVLAASVASALLTAGAVVVVGRQGPHGAAPPAAPAAPPADLLRRVAALEARLDETVAALARARVEGDAARQEAKLDAEAFRAEAAKEKERADAAESLLAGYTGEARSDADKKKSESMDAFAKEVAKGMRSGLRQEFRRISDLVTAPTPEALDQRRRQLKMFASAFGTNAGLDQAQVATLERILNETDERAREDLRPILQGVEDYRKVDYGKVKKVTDDVFVAQDQQFEKEFPRDKSDRLKQQLEPVRTVFGAMIDELQKESDAAKGE